MKLSKVTYHFYKELLQQKYAAIETENKVLLVKLRQQYPEIFNAGFLLQFLKQEFFADKISR
jgi:hypothetical protein